MTEAARSAIRWSFYAWPVAAYLIQLAVIVFWPMDGMHERIRNEVEARRAVAVAA